MSIKIEILNTGNTSIPERYKSLIVEDIMRVISSPKHNKGLDVEIIDIILNYIGRDKRPCSIENAVTICVKVKFQRMDHTREYPNRSNGHLGIEIFLPNKIKKRRSDIIDSIINNLDN